jgi:hypothetical protein
LIRGRWKALRIFMPSSPLHRDTYEKEIISLLLDKYEAGSSFRKDIKPVRRIMLKFYDSGVSDYPAYDIEKPEQRERINKAVLALGEAGLVFYEWMKGEGGHFIARVWLNLENINKAYTFLDRRPANDIAGEVCLEILDVLGEVKSIWIRRFLEESCEAISRRRAVGQGGPGSRIPRSREERQDLFRVLRFVDSLGETEMLERVFSMRCFGDSKKFETGVKKRLLDIVRHYADWDDETREDELLRFAGIVRYPQQFEFRGPLSISFDPVPSRGGAADGQSLDSLRRVHTPAPWGGTKGMYPESNTLRAQHTPTACGGVVDYVKPGGSDTHSRWLSGKDFIGATVTFEWTVEDDFGNREKLTQEMKLTE